MGAQDPANRDRILEGLLAGDLDSDDPAVRALLREDPSARERLEELGALVERLGAMGRSARDMLREAEELPAESGDLEAQRMLREALEERYAPKRPSSLRFLAPVAAVAAALLLWFWWKGSESPAPAESGGEPPTWVLGPESASLWPQGTVDSYSEFRWTLELPPGGYFEWAVFDDTPGGQGRELLRQADLTAATYAPADPAALERAQRIRWTVVAYDALGSVVDSLEASATLR